MGLIHLSHLHEDMSLTFGEIKDILRGIQTGDIEPIEKFDGQSIFFKWNAPDNSVKVAYSASEIRTGGKGVDEFAQRWAGHPAEAAFVGGANAIRQGIESFSQEELIDIFGNSGMSFVAAEIIFPDNPNMINYNGNYIVMHNLQKFDDAGKPVDAQLSGGEFGKLVAAVNAAEKDIDESNWSMIGPQIVDIKNLASGVSTDKYIGMLDSLTGMSDDATIGDYVEEQLRSGAVANLDIPIAKQEDLIKLITRKPGAPRLIDIKKGLPKEVAAQVSTLGQSKNRHRVIGNAVKGIERIISDYAVEILSGVESVLVGSHSEEIARLKAMLSDAVSQIEASENSSELMPMVERQLEKLGSVDNLTSTVEGIVFEYPAGSKKLYKLTGAFAMLNQIVGRARRLPAPTKESEQNEALLRNYVRAFIMG